jgi:hypothetical protein
MTMHEHAERELTLIGEDRDVIDGVLRIVDQVDALADSGPALFGLMSYLPQLLTFTPLTPLTSESEEWIDRSAITGSPLWQALRYPEAFSTDGGQTYWLTGDRSKIFTSVVLPLKESDING